MMILRNSGYVAVSDATQGEQLDYSHHGIDDDGPVPVVQQDYAVDVPDTTMTLYQEQERLLKEVRDAVTHFGDDDAIVAFQVVLEMTQSFLTHRFSE